MKQKTYTLDIAGKTLIIEVGKLAQQATSSVTARMGDTMILATVVSGKESDLGYFPLSVEYVERLYAGGKIKGSRWVKREGRPTDDSILTARLIDRSIRPLFPKEFKKDVQVVVTLLSVDGENEPDVLSLVAVSTALAMSKIPWNGPVGAVRMGHVKDPESGVSEFIVNPRTNEIELSDLDLVATQTAEKTLMLEAGARQIPEDKALAAIEKAHIENKKIIDFINGIAKEIGEKKEEVKQDTLFKDLTTKIEKSFKEDVVALVAARATKEATGTEMDELIGRIFDHMRLENPDFSGDKKAVAKALEYVSFQSIRENVVKNAKRVDGRKADEIRPIFVENSVLPRTHGSAIFQRGNTQALTIATLGSPRLGQLIESAEGEETKRYMHHYSMPPYSVGETGRTGFLSRREIGHGALAERALMAVIPSQDKFPYAIRMVSEIMSSNGSTSMAATCGSTLALMDAGVPIEKPVAGIAMGMMSKADKYVILTDILGLEDFSGDMDFKVAGTDSGVTAIQLDVKIDGLTIQQIKETFDRAKIARLFILEKMLAVIPTPRTQVSAFAPKIEQIKIPVEKIGEVIGPGGRVIKGIIADTGAIVDVEDDGTVTISGTEEEAVRKAADTVKGLVREVTPGEEFDGEVKRILPFGAFVEVLPGKEGMVHVSQMSTDFVKNPTDVVQIGDKVKVRVMEIDDQGRMNLSMLFGEDAKKKGTEGGGRDGDRGPRFEGNRDQGPSRGPSSASTQGQGPRVQSDHPLSMQFRRERMTKPGMGGRPTGRFPRKVHR